MGDARCKVGIAPSMTSLWGLPHAYGCGVRGGASFGVLSGVVVTGGLGLTGTGHRRGVTAFGSVGVTWGMTGAYPVAGGFCG
jgi:hypothetical protein